MVESGRFWSRLGRVWRSEVESGLSKVECGRVR